MKYTTATKENLEDIYTLVSDTISTVYPNYYPTEIVKSFLGFHSKENILRDIENQKVFILTDNGSLVGTGSYNDNHLNRLFVSKTAQNKGYGSYIMDRLEEIVAKNHDVAYLDATLPAVIFHENRGFKTIKFGRFDCGNGAILVYPQMEKKLK